MVTSPYEWDEKTAGEASRKSVVSINVETFEFANASE